jgi:hypothetical protein
MMAETTLSDGRVVVIAVDPRTDAVTIDPPLDVLASPDDVCAIGMGLVAASRIAGQRRAGRAAKQVRASARGGS